MRRLGGRKPVTWTLALVMITVSVLAAGCLRTDVGSKSTLDDYEGPRGHAFDAAFTASAASIAGILQEASSGDVTFIALENVSGRNVESGILVFSGGHVRGHGDGQLIVPFNGSVRVEGDATTYAANEVALTRDALRLVLRTDVTRDVDRSTNDQLMGTWVDSDVFFSDALDVTPGRALTVHAADAWFVSENANLTRVATPVQVEDAQVVSTTTRVAVERAPAEVATRVPGDRAGLAAENATGLVRLVDADRSVTLDGATAVTLGRDASVTLTPGADGVSVRADGRTFQVYANAGAQIPATLELQWAADFVTLDTNETRAVKFTIENPDPHTDAVITRADVTGVPNDAHVKLPGFRSITAEMYETFGHNAVGAVAVTLASPGLVLADAFLALIDAIFGAPAIPQVIESGTAFTTEASVTKGKGSFTVELVLEGNFPTERGTLQVR